MNAKIKLAVIGFVIGMIAALLISTQRTLRQDSFIAAFDAEFLSRPDGYPGLREAYGLDLKQPPLQMDPGLMYRALAEGTVNLIDGFATDGRIPAYNLVTLKDDKGFFPPYHAAPLVRKETLEKHPEIAGILNTLSGRISDEKMQEMNYMVDEKGMRAYNVAKNFLEQEGLLKENNGDNEGTVRIGGKHFTEQEILGEIMALLIESNSGLRVERRLNLGGTIICFNALRTGDIDIYAEYTGTGLVNILNEDVIDDPMEAYMAVKERFEDDYELVWLEPFGFNNTYTLTMREEEAEQLGIKTISDLVEYLKTQ